MANIRVSWFLIIATATLLANALPKQDISTFVTNRYLGDIKPVTAVTEKKILNAFVRNNPNLPVALQDTKDRTKYISANVIYPDGRAIIDVSTASFEYGGFVEVYFNGGQPINPNVIRDVINLSQTKQSIRIQQANPTDKQIIDAFLTANNNLATKANHLQAVLKVRRLPNHSASLYVDPPQSTIIGNSVVSW